MPLAAGPSQDRSDAPGCRRAAALWAVVHELTEPLTALAGYLHVARHRLEQAGGQDAVVAEILEKAAAQLRRADAAVLQLRPLLPQDPAAGPDPGGHGT